MLINVHGGGFSMCADACRMLEAVPVAAMGGYKVVTIDYRMGRSAPSRRDRGCRESLPRAAQEIQAGCIGLYGCSAGGALTAQVAAWLPGKGLPQPGAIGIFGAGGTRFMTGDLAYVAGYIDGSFPPPP